MSKLWQAGAVLAAVLAILGWYKVQIQRAERAGAIKAAVEEVQARADSLLGDSALAWARQDSAREAAVAALSLDLVRARQEVGVAARSARSASRRADSVLAVLREAGDTASVVVIVAALDSGRAALTSCQAALGTCDSVTIAQRALLVTRAGRITDLETLARDQDQAIDALRRSIGASPMRPRELFAWGIAIAATVTHLLR